MVAQAVVVASEVVAAVAAVSVCSHGTMPCYMSLLCLLRVYHDVYYHTVATGPPDEVTGNI